MKKTITIIVIVILALGAGWYLFKISGGTEGTSNGGLDLSNLEGREKPAEVQADDHVLGSLEAKNTVVAFEDFQCPACRTYEPTLKSLATELPDTKVVFRHFPLVSRHKNALPAAYASEAAAAQGKFWEWAALAYERQEQWQGESNPIENFLQMARDAGVGDLDKFRADAENKTYREKVQRDVREATALKVGGTPTIYYNGIELELAGLDGIRKQVEQIQNSKQ